MRPWASWTAKTALLAAGFAAAGGGLSGVALAGPGGSSTPGTASVLGSNPLHAPRGIPASVCIDAGALLGIARAACLGGATANLPAQGPRQTGLSGMTSGNVPPGGGRAVSIPLGACGNPAAVLGDSTAGCAGGAMAAMTGSTDNGSAGSAVKSAVAPVTSALGAAGRWRDCGRCLAWLPCPASPAAIAAPAARKLSRSSGRAACPRRPEDRAVPLLTRSAPAQARATRTFRPRLRWPDSGPFRASRTCPRWPV